MKARGSGRIINISSIGGLAGIAARSVYCASKAGVITLTKALACELAPHGINVNAIAPGHTSTPGNAHLRTDPAFTALVEAITARTPSGRAWSEPDDMARAAVFLACGRQPGYARSGDGAGRGLHRRHLKRVSRGRRRWPRSR